MENENNESKKKAYGVLAEAVFEFIGRVIGNAIIGFLRAFFGALTLAYPLKWFWNSISQKIANFEAFDISYWTAFKVLLITGMLFRRQITVKDQIKEVEKEDLND